MSGWLALLCDGAPATAQDLAAPALVNDGHFSTLQVRGGAARGFDLHLQRLCEATRLLFDAELAPARVRRDCAAALAAAGVQDATLRATVFRRPGTGVPALLVSVAAPAEPSPSPLRVKSFGFVRTLPEVKHVGTFPLFHHHRLAERAGFDDALFVAPGGRVCEGSVWNLGFFCDAGVTWPDGPALRGVTERLLQAGLDAAGVPQAVRPVRLDEVGAFRGAFACNSRGLQPIAAIDAVRYARDDAFADAIGRALDSRPWQPIAEAPAPA
ncbi:aminotransferase class IV [Luteimonas sp. Y-2-2-4F]|nr:aminotransferase class IV [Luteimonas sp. Y-2-2-4F]MCD9031589.1 aminotransferase class IV [Luteimonas sp. Y-2-2-4F]MCD9031836.1 aminotransferase class IV [Luteimonas sp. Y-2-2-4F]